ncbi:MAG: tRNA (adenosine(37)-N6)-dimethylallyltransferase MiaA [Clostridia bacterium]|nr:tRNA (adenosine(37)-N6)-dimethylallyltransferase MiaA [Clostridia bacterium]
MHPLFVLVGPTAVGKTKISIEVAKKINGEIISGDSMQVYKHLNIGTAKVKPEETQGIPHHLIDIKEPTENFSVAEFKKLAEQKIEEIAGKNKFPMLVGGTGLYINSVINNYNFSEENSTEIRKKLKETVREQGIEVLLEKLKEVDPISAEKIHPNDERRILRALEVYYSTGKPISAFHNSNNCDINNAKYKLVMVGLNLNREKLYERINLRVDQMLEEGWLSEIEHLLKQGVSPDAPALQGLGYKQLVMYLEGRLDYEKAVELVKRDTRRFAKRQLTWFKRDNRIYWIQMDNKKENEVLEEIITYIGRSI